MKFVFCGWAELLVDAYDVFVAYYEVTEEEDSLFF